MMCSLFFIWYKKTMVADVTNLCWIAPHQSPHSAPSDRTGSAWSRPLPPPQTGQPLWSTRTPPPFECRHLTDKCSQVISVAPLVVCCHAQPRGASFRSGRKARREKQNEVSYSHHPVLLYLGSFPLIFSSCLVSPLSCKFRLSCLICSVTALLFYLVSVSADLIAHV